MTGSRTNSGRRIVVAVVLVLLVVPALWLGWPAQFGGKTAYVTTYGISMEPGFHAGDLAITRAAEDYRVGDVVAYRSNTLDRIVMHRVVAVEDGRYTFQGDNNDFLDPDHPTTEKFVGTMVFRIPSGGTWLARLTSPSALAAFAFLMVIGGGGTAVHVRRRHRRNAPASRRTRLIEGPSMTITSWSPPMRTAAGAIAAAGVLGGVVAALAWTGPLEQAATTREASDHSMVFAYSAPVGKTPAYDGDSVSSPDPVFRAVVDAVDVRFRYEGGPGTVTVDAELAAASGWRSTVRLAKPVTFDGDAYDGVVKLDLKALESKADAAATATGLPVNQVGITVKPRVEMAGGEVFAPTMKLNLDEKRLTLDGDAKALTVTDSTEVERATSSPRKIGLLGRDVLPVAVARVLSIGLLLVSVLGLAGLAFAARPAPPTSEGEGIRRRYAQQLVRVDPIPLPPERPVVDVVEFKTLARLAERYGLLVLCWSDRNADTFVVQDQGMTYRYRTVSLAVDLLGAGARAAALGAGVDPAEGRHRSQD